MSEEKISQVSPHARETPSGNVTQVKAHSRRIFNKRKMTEEEKAEYARQRADIAQAWRDIAPSETEDTDLMATEDFQDLNTQNQMLAVAVMSGVPPLLHGATATGKTTALSTLADSIGFGLLKFFPHRYEANDMAGLPATVDEMNEEGKKEWALRHFPVQWAKQAAGGNYIVLIDELLRANEQVQGAIMGMLDDHGLPEAGIKFGPGVRFVAATNPTTYDAGSYDIIPPLQRRFFNMGWPADIDGMKDFVDHNYWEVFDGLIPPPSKEEFVLGYHKWRSLTSGFINANGRVHLHNEPTEEQAASQKKNAEMNDLDPGLGWPNMDAWKKVWRMLSVADHVGASDDTYIQILNCALGEGTASEFWTYQSNLDLPNINEIIADPSSFKGVEREDQAFIVANQLTDRLRDGGNGKDFAAVFEIMDKIEKTHMDIAIPKQQMLCEWFMRDQAEGTGRFADAPPDMVKRIMERADDYMEELSGAGLGFMNKNKNKGKSGEEKEQEEFLNYSFDPDEDIRP